MAHGHGQLGAKIRRCQTAAAAQVEKALADMHIAVADPGGRNLDQHFLALRHRLFTQAQLQRLAPFDDLVAVHDITLNKRRHQFDQLVLSTTDLVLR